VNYGRYEIIREIGRGSMGVVYQARDPQIDRMVALKVLRQDRVSTDTFVSRFLKEAKVIGRLSHPNIVTIYDVGNEQGNIYIAMELLEGKSLSDLLCESHPAPDRAMEIGIQISETLEYAHEKGVIHRDIKPSNIIVGQDGRIKITDFGIARIEDASATLQTQTGEILGTPAYMSPEQIMGQPVDRRADIFSLGVLLYEMTAGSRPFGGEGKTLASVFNDIIRVTPPEPYIISSIVPRKLSGIIMKALQKEPEKRFSSGREMAEALRECLHKSGPAEEAKTVVQGKKKNYVLPAAVAIAGVVLAAVMYYLLQNMNTSEQHPAVEQINVVPLKKQPPVEKPVPEQDINLPVPVQESNVEQKTSEVPRVNEVKKQVPVKSEQKPALILVPLTLNSSPRGANVYIDENFRGTTPVTIMIAKGEHQVKLTLPGYRDAERQFTMEETMEYPLTFNLQAISGPGE